jgi:hypothetical protein
MAEKGSEENTVEEESGGSIPAQIQSFASKLGDEVGNHFTCYVYRVVKDEETGKYKRPFVKRFVGVEPDPLEIAEKFRGGTYAFQFVWKSKSKADKGNKSFTLDVDHEAFPALPKEDRSHLPFNHSGISESAQLQLASMQIIADVMKSAYSAGGPMVNGRGVAQADPLDAFSAIMETMENSYSRAMAMQQKIMERVLTRKMEKDFGLAEEVPLDPDRADAGESVLIGKYTPIIREVVEGLKMVMGLFGTVPPEMVKKVQSDERFKGLLKDQKALVVIGQALRREFGDQRAGELMNTFGVRMVVKDPARIAQTPAIASVNTGRVPSCPDGPQAMKQDLPAGPAAPRAAKGIKKGK